MSRVTLHCQGVPSWTGDFLSRAKSTHVKGIGNYPSYPGIVTIGRPYYEQSLVDVRVREGTSGVDVMFNAVKGEVTDNPQVGIWETPANEVSIWDTSVAARYVEFTQQMIGRFHGINKKIIVGAINTGWPRLPSEDGGAMMRLVAEACQGADGLSFHEYGWNSMEAGATYQCLRYRRFHAWCMNNGYTHPPLYITECGLDQTPGPDFGHSGWKIILNNNADEYVRQLAWYESELDSYVKCATVFTAGPSGWWSFEMDEGVSMKLADAIADTPQVERAKSFFLSEYQNEISVPELRDIWDAGYRAVHIRASAGLTEDVMFVKHWANAGQIGFLRSAWHFLTQNQAGQAAFFKSVIGDRQPEIGIWGDFEAADLILDKCNSFLEAADRNFGLTCDVYTRASWLDPRGVPPWQSQGRELWICSIGGGEEPVLPEAFTDWTFWQWGCGRIPPFPETVCMDVFNGTDTDLYEKYKVEPPLPTNLKYIWYDGTEVPEQQFRSEFGDFEIITADAQYHVKELRAATAYATFRCKVVDKNGNPATSEQLVYSWPDAPALPGAGWDERGVVSEIKVDGWGEHSMGTGEYYTPPDRGPAQCWVYGPGKSDYVDGIGMLSGTNHNHFDVVMVEGDIPSMQHTLTVDVLGNGSITMNPAGPIYDAGTTVILSAEPEEGWKFVGWSGDVTTTSNPTTVVMDSDKIIIATFTEEGNNQEAIEYIIAAYNKLEDALSELERALDALGWED